MLVKEDPALMKMISESLDMISKMQSMLSTLDETQDNVSNNVSNNEKED